MSSRHPFTVQIDRRPRFRDLRRLRGPDTEADLEAHVRLEVAETVQTERARISPPEHFDGRSGFDPDFLDGFHIELPTAVGARAREVMPVEGDARGRLDYDGFSIVMCASRRMAMFAAANIEGAHSVSIENRHEAWSIDGRLPAEAQLGEDFYAGSRLARGRLVQHGHAIPGDSRPAVSDSYHFTNCVPRMEAMSRRTWLGLEGYILRNARLWHDRCSVFTGPVLASTDLSYRGAHIPAAFWKVIAFLSSDGRPSATAYVIEPARKLRELEAAFDAYKTYQKSIRYVEAIAGVSFGTLASFDGLSNEEDIEGGLQIACEIRVLGDIRL